ncbi:MAG TPA: BrxA/BrxB family bacilliredoxin [Planctomycetota bacterium]|nr:BrxA/BrxB family bacilliredoxin [Planctomycetota bacterium]
MYDPVMVAPMRDELTKVGVKSLASAADVDKLLAEQTGTTMVVVNSVCGCAAANARPGVALAMKHSKLPKNAVTVFAGVDREATDRARSYFKGYMPSSPSVALLKDGQCVFVLQRHEIEGRDPQAIARKLTDTFDKFC